MLGESEYARKIVTVSHDDGKVIYYSRPQYPIVFLSLFLCICIIAFFLLPSLYVFLSLHAREYIAYWELWCLTDKKEWRHINCWFQFRCWRNYLPKSTKDIYCSSSINSCSRRGSISFSRFLKSLANFNVGHFSFLLNRTSNVPNKPATLANITSTYSKASQLFTCPQLAFFFFWAITMHFSSVRNVFKIFRHKDSGSASNMLFMGGKCHVFCIARWLW